jgi:hypothetical protein
MRLRKPSQQHIDHQGPKGHIRLKVSRLPQRVHLDADLKEVIQNRPLGHAEFCD